MACEGHWGLSLATGAGGEAWPPPDTEELQAQLPRGSGHEQASRQDVRPGLQQRRGGLRVPVRWGCVHALATQTAGSSGVRSWALDQAHWLCDLGQVISLSVSGFPS